MEVKLRDPRNLMKLSKLGSFHQSKLSFLRSFLNEFKDWNYNRDLFQLNTKSSILILIIINLILAGMSLRIGGYLSKGPYLPETLEGITKTTKAVLGKN